MSKCSEVGSIKGESCQKCLGDSCENQYYRNELSTLRAQLAECEESNKAVELALEGVSYKGSYADGIRYLIAQLADQRAVATDNEDAADEELSNWGD